MLDSNARNALVERLRHSIKKASVSTKVEAAKGPFRIVISEKDNAINHFYKEHLIGTIKVASLDDDVVELINSDARGTAQQMVETLAETFDVNSFERELSAPNGHVKQAANAVVDQNTAQMVTQKQLTDHEPSLHPRQNSAPSTITQRQLPDANLRPGTYNVTTEAQLREEKSTFYGEQRTAGEWKDEDRKIVTEGQFNEGTDNYSTVGQSDRGQIGAEFSGGPEKQSHMVAEKQLAELLSHHTWTDPHTVTEGKEQLGKQKGELARIAAADARKLVQATMAILGKTVVAAGVTPDNLITIVKQLISHPSKYPILANVIDQYKPLSTQAIEQKIQTAQYFGKVANVTNQSWSQTLVADILVRQLSKLAFHPQYIVDGLVAMSENVSRLSNDIDKAVNSVLADKTASTDDPESNINVFKTVLSHQHKSPDAVNIEGNDDDGCYQYAGTIDEVGVNPADRDAFSKAAAEYAQKIITANINRANVKLVPINLDVNEDNGTFRLNFKDPVIADPILKARSENRQKLASTTQEGMTKVAQMPSGGMPPSGAGGMANPAPPPSNADASATPPGASFSQEPPAPEQGLEGGDDLAGDEPKPLGSICGICGSTDVNLDNGEQHCNNCGAHGVIHVQMEYDKAPGVIQEKEEDDKAGFGIGSEDENGLGAPNAPPEDATGGTGTTMPNIPVAASVRITPRLLEKLAAQQIELGSVCPNCGSSNTDSIKSASHKGKDGICWDCWQEWNLQIKTIPGKKHSVFAQTRWNHKVASNPTSNCMGCTRLHKEFIKSLSSYGMTWKEYDKLSLIDRADTILKMASAGALSLSIDLSPSKSLNKVAATFKAKFEKFPSASCRERIARRFGENSTAMAGPCQGKKLHECVCAQLEDLGIYTDGLAAKVAHTLASTDPMENSPTETCVKMFVKDYNYNVNQACTICAGLRAAGATPEDLLIEAITKTDPSSVKMAQFASTVNAPAPSKAPGTSATGGPTPMTQQPKQKPLAAGPAKPLPSVDDHPMSSSINDEPMDDGGPGDNVPPVETDDALSGPTGDIHDGPSDGELDVHLDDDNGDGLDMDFDIFDHQDDGISFDHGDGEVSTDSLKTIIVDGLQSIIDALNGNTSDNMFDDTGDDLTDSFSDGTDLSTDEVTDGVVDETPLDSATDTGELSSETPDISDTSDDIGSTTDDDTPDGGIPGVVDEDSDELVKSSDPDTESSPDKSLNSKKNMSKPDITEKPKSDSKECAPTHSQDDEGSKDCSASSDNGNAAKEAQIQGLHDDLMHMKTGTIRTAQQSLNSIYQALMKQAEKNKQDIVKTKYTESKESKLSKKPAQDSSDIGKYQGGQTIGHEESFSTGVKTSPDIPRGDATIGAETADVKLNDKEYPSIPQNAPAMEGEEHYKPEKQTVIDGNQGANTTKADSQQQTKVAGSCKCGDKMECPKCKNCNKCCQCKSASKKDKNIKTSQKVVTPKRVDGLEDDPDLNNSSGPGKGQISVDKPHSLAVDEKKPSEGVNEPDVPKAPNGGRLNNEHTVDKATDGPSVPAGGGMNSTYDQNEKNTPEKTDEMLGNVTTHTTASVGNKINDRAIKIAGLMVKNKMITPDDLPNKIAELSQLSNDLLNNFEQMMQKETNASKKGTTKEASQSKNLVTAWQTNIDQPHPDTMVKNSQDAKAELINKMTSLFSLTQRNQDYERITGIKR